MLRFPPRASGPMGSLVAAWAELARAGPPRRGDDERAEVRAPWERPRRADDGAEEERAPLARPRRTPNLEDAEVARAGRPRRALASQLSLQSRSAVAALSWKRALAAFAWAHLAADRRRMRAAVASPIQGLRGPARVRGATACASASIQRLTTTRWSSLCTAQCTRGRLAAAFANTAARVGCLSSVAL